MRTIKTKVFTFEELSEESQLKAINEVRSIEDFDYIYSESYQTVKAFNNLFNLKEGSLSWLDFSTNLDENIIELKGLRLRKWIINNFHSHLYTRKYLRSFSGPKYHPMTQVKNSKKGQYSTGYSRIQKTNDCVLTGVCCDYSILSPIYEFIDNYTDKPDYNSYQDIEGLISECFENLKQNIESEIQYITSKEGIIENINSNGYEFTEDGELI